MKKILGLFIICSLLSGCSHMQYEDAFVRPEYINRSEMGMVVARIKVPYKDVLNKQGIFNGSMIVRELNSSIKYKINGTSYDESASMLKPGIYQIDSVEWNDGTFVYHFDIKDNQLHPVDFTFGAFELKPGECLYLGDITIDKYTRNDKEILSVENHSEQVSKSLETESLQAFKPKIKFYSLLKNSNVISKNENGKLNINKGKTND